MALRTFPPVFPALRLPDRWSGGRNPRQGTGPCRPVRRSARTQRGQALTEFLAVALALVPLFLLIPVVAKYQDISHATQAASRYAAFDAMASNDSTSGWKGEQQLAEEVRRRFFSNATAPIKTNDSAGNFKAHQNLYWRRPDDRPLIEDLQRDVQLRFGPANASQPDGGFQAAGDGAPFALLAPMLGLDARGIYSAQISVTLARMPSGLRFYEPLDSIQLSMTRGTGVLINPWVAKGPADVESRIAGNVGVFPAAPLRAVGVLADPLVTMIDALGAEQGPLLGKLEFWRDVVPEDRLRERRDD